MPQPVISPPASQPIENEALSDPIALTPLQARFVERYLINGGVAADAYSFAQPDATRSKAAAASLGSKMRHSMAVEAALGRARALAEAALERALARYEITADRVADELARIAFTRINDVTDLSTVEVEGKRVQRLTVKDYAATDERALAAVAKIRHQPGGGVSVELADKQGALMKLAQLKGWIADKPQPVQQAVIFKIERS